MVNNLKSKKILTYDDVVPFTPGKDKEPLVDVRKYDDTIAAEYIKKDMLGYTGEVIYIRDTLAQKIAKVERGLKKEGYRLKVVYGYRHPEVQKKYFMTRQEALKHEYPQLSTQELDKFTHSFVAIPDVAGHPAGAALDLTITDTSGNYIDMGTGIADYSNPEKIITYAEGLTPSQIEHRKLLHDLMVREGFAPYYGEWWHFSYGDREWAAFYNKKARYGAIDFKTPS